ncbi:phosphotransferase [Candidatus Binatia bacterium]|nr:phosphotransferase [Candidatus Binatia bacterium]
MPPEVPPLFDALIRDRFGGTAAVREVVPLAGDASTRRYARLYLAGAGVPPTAVAMLLADRGIAMSSDELAVFEEAPRELPYLNVHRFLAPLGVPVPEVYADASEQGVVILEDIGDTALWDAVQGRDDDTVLALYRRAIDELLRLQIEGTTRRDRRCIAFQQAFDERLFLWELEHFIEYGIERRLDRPLPAEDAALLRAHFAIIARRLDAQPRYLNHRDFHSWNLYLHGDRIRVIDFQDALLAPAPYDLATLLGDRDTPLIVRPDLEAALLDYYARRWIELAGRAPGGDAIEEVYVLCALQKALKVVGRFYYLDIVKGKKGYLRYIPSTVRQIERLLPRFPQHVEMAAVIRRYLPRDQCAR